MPKVLIKSLAAAAIFLVAPLGAHANQVFNYTGNPFHLFPPGSPYTTANRITFSFEVADPLPANLFHDGTGVNPLNWTMTDGLQTGSSADPAWSLGFAFDTDAAGTVLGWLIGASSLTGVMQIKHWAGGVSGPNLGYELASITGVGSSDNDNDPLHLPTWTVTDTAAVPEPGALALLGTGLALLVLFRRCRVGDFRRSAVSI